MAIILSDEFSYALNTHPGIAGFIFLSKKDILTIINCRFKSTNLGPNGKHGQHLVEDIKQFEGKEIKYLAIFKPYILSSHERNTPVVKTSIVLTTLEILSM